MHMSKLNYNKRRHLKLLKLRNSKEKILTSTEKLELDEYSSLLDSTLDWETKDQFLDLLEELISGKINSFKFYIEFLKRNDSNSEVFDSLEANFLLLSPYKKSKKFSNFINEIMDFCQSYAEVFESPFPEEKIDLYDVEFRNAMEKIYFKMKQFLNEE